MQGILFTCFNSQENRLYYSQPRNPTSAQNPCSKLVYTTISTIEKIMELKAVIVQVFQDGTHLDDILRHI